MERHFLRLLIALALVACAEPRPAGPTPLLLGARMYTEDPERWQFDAERRPRLRVPPGTAVAADWGGVALRVRVDRRSQDWTFLVLDGAVPEGDATLTVAADGSTHHWPVRWGVPPDDLPGLREVVAARKAGRFAEAEALLAKADAPFWAEVERARLERRQGRRAEAARLAWDAAQVAAAARAPGEAARRYRLAAIYAREAGDLELAQTAVSAAAAAAQDPESQALTRFNQGQVARAQHRFQAASEHFARAVEDARAVGHDDVLFRQHQAEVAQLLGRHGFARSVIQALPIRSWVDLNNWTYLAWQSRSGCAPDAQALVDLFEVVARTVPEGRPQSSHVNAWSSLAHAALATGDVARATDALARADAVDPTGGAEPLFRDLLGARLALAHGDPDAARDQALALIERAARVTGRRDNDTAWRALHVLGQALDQSDTDDAATRSASAAWRAGLAMVERLGAAVAVRGARSSFLAERRALVADLVRAHLDAGEVEAAFAVVDAHRMPALRRLAVDARASGLGADGLREWGRRLTAHESARRAVARQREACVTASGAEQSRCAADVARLEAVADLKFEQTAAWLDAVAPTEPMGTFTPQSLGPDEALLAVVALETTDGCGTEWHAFVVADGRYHHSVGQLPGVLPGQPLHGRRRIYVVDGGHPDALALGQTPVEGGSTLAAQVELVYLPAAAILARRIRPLEARTLVVADPRGDLPHARETAAQLNAGEVLSGPAATRAALLERLDGLRWLHYDGHGDLAQGDPFAAHLRLADGALTATDLLVHRPNLGLVVLAGCETGRAQALSEVERMGLAEAFLLAGARAVLAADRVLPDAEAARFTRAFHAAGGTDRPAAALRQVIRDFQAVGDEAWRGWRLFGQP